MVLSSGWHGWDQTYHQGRYNQLSTKKHDAARATKHDTDTVANRSINGCSGIVVNDGVSHIFINPGMENKKPQSSHADSIG